MPIAHIVLFKWKPEATAAQIAHAINDAPKILKAIDGVIEFISGENFTQRSKGFTHAFYATFTNKEALQRYTDHSIHQNFIKETLLPIREDVLAFDFEY